MKLLKDTAAQASLGMVIQLVIVIVLVGIIGLVGIYIDDKIADKTALTDISAKTGTFTFSGNISNAELVNITYGSAVYRFEFNTTSNGNVGCVTTNCIRVELATGFNKSALASGNLTAAINNNASTAALVTAVNTTNVTTLTAITGGTAITITLADNTANVTSSGMSGGTNKDTFYDSQDDAVDAVETGFDFLEIIILAIVAGIIILAIFSYIPIKL